MSRRSLGEMLAEVGLGMLPAMAQSAPLAVRSICVDLPVEFALRRRGDELLVLGELPRRVLRTGFDITPSRLRVVWQARSDEA